MRKPNPNASLPTFTVPYQGPITYLSIVRKEMSSYASVCQTNQRSLRRLGRAAIRTRLNEARMHWPSDPNPIRIYVLEVEKISIFFSYEAGGVRIRGFGIDSDESADDDFAHGGFVPYMAWNS